MATSSSGLTDSATLTSKDGEDDDLEDMYRIVPDHAVPSKMSAGGATCGQPSTTVTSADEPAPTQPFSAEHENDTETCESQPVQPVSVQKRKALIAPTKLVAPTEKLAIPRLKKRIVLSSEDEQSELSRMILNDPTSDTDTVGQERKAASKNASNFKVPALLSAQDNTTSA